MLKKLISNIALGFSLGIIIGDGIVMLSGWVSSGRLIVVSGSLLGKTNEEIILAFIIQSLLSGLYGALAFGGVIFYEIERIPHRTSLFVGCGTICTVIAIPRMGWRRYRNYFDHGILSVGSIFHHMADHVYDIQKKGQRIK